MSGGTGCKCAESKKPIKDGNWKVIKYKYNESAFSGYRRTPSDYSIISCQSCPATWRTKAKYVEELL